MKARTLNGRVWCIAATLLLVAGCGSQVGNQVGVHSARSAAPASRLPPHRQKPAPVSVRFPFLVEGSDAPYVLSIVDGAYRKQGLAVTAQPGSGSGVSLQLAASGHIQFGVADCGLAATLISKPTPMKVVAAFIQGSPLAIIHDKSVVIRTPKDLVGKQIITTAGSAPLNMLRAIIGRYGVKEKQLTIDEVGANAQVPLWARHRKQAVLLSPITGVFQQARALDPNAVYDLYSKYGFNFYNTCVVTSTAEIRSHPAVVRAFVAGSVQGWQRAAQDPKQAVAAVLHLFPAEKAPVEMGGLVESLRLVHTPATKGHVPGWMAPSDWRAMLQDLHRYTGIKLRRSTGDYYTDAFLPKG